VKVKAVAQRKLVMSTPKHVSCGSSVLKPIIKQQQKVSFLPPIIAKQRRRKTSKMSTKPWEPEKRWDISQERSKVTTESTKMTRKEQSPEMRHSSCDHCDLSEEYESDIEEVELKTVESSIKEKSLYAFGRSDLFQGEESLQWTIPMGQKKLHKEPSALKRRRSQHSSVLH
jgi:hypothetical protein